VSTPLPSQEATPGRLAAVATGAGECCRCGEPTPPAKPGYPRKRLFCSNACRTQFWDAEHPRQKRLPLEPPTELVQRIGPTPEDVRKAKKPQTVKVLRMLQEGPKTTHDFLGAFIGRFGARIGELRQVGHTIRRKDLSGCSSVYMLVDEDGAETGGEG